ncbi:hypothetical protein CPB84DRAFT_1750862 [Gymnopilus junonius]|uniref:Uncharacterized protein n=1 Tax=Gymnopilus junonius TaxID=109634 RepID=A0A9P5NFQ0_GYMJU|nr:hypothetical protein CPB84DRAFT_1750862 [Gymnopilus junonius]
MGNCRSITEQQITGFSGTAKAIYGWKDDSTCELPDLDFNNAEIFTASDYCIIDNNHDLTEETLCQFRDMDKSNNHHLAYFNTHNLTNDQVDTYVELHIMDGIYITVPDDLDSEATKIVDSIKDTISAHFQEILKNSDSGGWEYNELDKAFGIGLASQRPIRINALVAYYSSSMVIAVAGQAETVDMIYMYFFGVVYELQPTNIVQDMQQSLCKNIPGINLYAFHFPDDDSGITSNIKYWRAFFEFMNFDPGVSEIQDKVEEQVFGPDNTIDLEIRHGLQKKVYNFMVKTFKNLAGPSYPKEDNEWYSLRKQNNFPYISDTGSDWEMQVRTSWVYANAKVTETARGRETVEHFYLSLLLVRLILMR